MPNSLPPVPELATVHTAPAYASSPAQQIANLLNLVKSAGSAARPDRSRGPAQVTRLQGQVGGTEYRPREQQSPLLTPAVRVILAPEEKGCGDTRPAR